MLSVSLTPKVSLFQRTVFLESTLQELAATGCYLEYDLFGMYQSGYYPHNPDADLLNDAGRVKQIQWLIEQGAGKQLLVSQDIAGNHRLSEWGGHGYHYLLKEILPQMRRRGMTPEECWHVFEGNPQSVLTFAAPIPETPAANPTAATTASPRM